MRQLCTKPHANGKPNGNGHHNSNGTGHGNGHHTLAELVETVTKLTHDERLSAYIVADMINTRQVKLEGPFHGRRVVIG
jgi:hypothetical protein